MPSATLNNSDPGSAIGQAGKSHSPASFKIKGQGGIKEKDNTSLKQRLHSAVPISQLPKVLLQGELWSPGAAVVPRHSTSQPTSLPAADRGTWETQPPALVTPLLQPSSKKMPALQQAPANPAFPSCLHKTLSEQELLQLPKPRARPRQGFPVGLDHH